MARQVFTNWKKMKFLKWQFTAFLTQNQNVFRIYNSEASFSHKKIKLLDNFCKMDLIARQYPAKCTTTGIFWIIGQQISIFMSHLNYWNPCKNSNKKELKIISLKNWILNQGLQQMFLTEIKICLHRQKSWLTIRFINGCQILFLKFPKLCLIETRRDETRQLAKVYCECYCQTHEQSQIPILIEKLFFRPGSFLEKK